MTNLRGVEPNERPFIEVFRVSRMDADSHARVEAGLLERDKRLFGDRYWRFNHPECSQGRARAVGQLVLANAMANQQLVDARFACFAFSFPINEGQRSGLGAYLMMVAPRQVEIAPNEDDCVSRTVCATNTDLRNLGLFYELPLTPKLPFLPPEVDASSPTSSLPHRHLKPL